MKSRVSSLVIASLVAAYSLAIPALEEVAAQTDSRGMRVEQGSQTERRVALVIGNSAYKDSPLLNPVNDAKAMAQTLRSLRFEVLYGENLSQNDMKRNIRAFGEKIRNGGVGLFYYAGHGIQIRGINYLIPVGATIVSEEEVEYESVDVGLVLAQMAAARNQLNIVILDACRNNPFARSFRSAEKGLASIDAPSGTLLAYATAPGSVASDGEGANGLYTQELLKNMRLPGASIEKVFKQVRIGVQDKTQGKQVPWESSSLVGDFYFSVVGPVSVTINNGLPSVDPAVLELNFWESIKNSNDPAEYQAYLNRFPNGTFAELARRRARPKTPETTTIGTTEVAKEDEALLTNGGFENGYRGWGTGYVETNHQGKLSPFWASWVTSGDKLIYANVKGQIDSIVKKSGLNSLKIINNSPTQPNIFGSISQRIIGLQPNTEYVVSFWVKSEMASAGTLEITTDLKWLNRRVIEAGTYDWRKFTHMFRTDEENFIDLRIISEAPGIVWIDDVTVKRHSPSR